MSPPPPFTPSPFSFPLLALRSPPIGSGVPPDATRCRAATAAAAKLSRARPRFARGVTSRARRGVVRVGGYTNRTATRAPTSLLLSAPRGTRAALFFTPSYSAPENDSWMRIEEAAAPVRFATPRGLSRAAAPAVGGWPPPLVAAFRRCRLDVGGLAVASAAAGYSPSEAAAGANDAANWRK